MKRPVAIGVVTAALGGALIVATLAGSQQSTAVAEARAQSERASAAVRRASVRQAAPAAKKRGRLTKVCPRGAEGLGNSARRAIRRKLLDDNGRVDLEALAEMSNIAIATGRYLERKRAAPALPQRMGRTRGPDGWQPLPTPKVGCALVAY